MICQQPPFMGQVLILAPCGEDNIIHPLKADFFMQRFLIIIFLPNTWGDVTLRVTERLNQGF